MENKNLIRFVESFVLLPFMTISMPLGSVTENQANTVLDSQITLSPKENIETLGLLAFNQEVDQKVNTLKIKAEAIDAYFKEHDMPLLGKGEKLVEEAEKNNLDWRLLAAIAVRESTGGKHDCKKVENNPFGWGSCKIGFKTLDEAIETIGRNLGGNNPNTAHHYSGKDTKDILQKYNPPSIVKNYAEQVMSIMDEIGDKDITILNS
ncbi:MAG TPA: glucosaminidase domain-containing protein [Candidatus Paceibacterota bacterium]|nr:glucosaminidase domain-containing protein [Candidatus Paceibacterota bacterium]HPT18200.1 glucosaminidase domain-containing protein [Candidatus Paceibacterota bacterium]